MIGGLGGFVLPIAFGALNDLTGLWSSCFMLLFADRRALASCGCISPIRRMSRGRPRLRAALRCACRSEAAEDQDMTEKLVIIGNGMAPGRMLEHLLEAAPGRYQVTIFNAEPRVNYDRIMLSPVLSGEKAFEEIVIHGDGWYIKQRHHALQGPQDRRHRPRGEDRHVRPRRDRALRQAGHRHRLGAVHHSGARQRPAGRAHLSRSRRRQRHAARRAVAAPRRWSSAAACSASKRPPASTSAAWTSPCCT